MRSVVSMLYNTGGTLAFGMVFHGGDVYMAVEEAAEIGLVACPHGCHVVGLPVDMGFLCTFYKVL